MDIGEVISLESNQQYIDSQASSNPMEEVESSIDRELLMAKLSERQRKIAEYLEQGYSANEIAGFIGVHFTTIHTQIRKMKTLLEKNASI